MSKKETISPLLQKVQCLSEGKTRVEHAKRGQTNLQNIKTEFGCSLQYSTVFFRKYIGTLAN